MSLKPPLSFAQQIERLRSHGVVINNPSFAKKTLSEVNYYRLSGYLLQFRKNSKESDLIKDVPFEKIIEIYKLDEELRSFLRIYLEKIEIYYRTQIAYYFAESKCKKEPYDQHYDEDNFENKKGYNEIRNSFKVQKKYYKDSLIFKHHNKVYDGKMPLWVIVEFLSFSSLSKLYNAMLKAEKDIIANASRTGAKMLSNNLHCLSVFRNKCAHGARLYNTVFSPPAKFNSSFLKENRNVEKNTFFAYFFILLKRLPDFESKQSCINSFISLVLKNKDKIDLSLLGIPDNYKAIINTIII